MILERDNEGDFFVISYILTDHIEVPPIMAFAVVVIVQSLDRLTELTSGYLFPQPGKDERQS